MKFNGDTVKPFLITAEPKANLTLKDGSPEVREPAVFIVYMDDKGKCHMEKFESDADLSGEIQAVQTAMENIKTVNEATDIKCIEFHAMPRRVKYEGAGTKRTPAGFEDNPLFGCCSVMYKDKFNTPIIAQPVKKTETGEIVEGTDADYDQCDCPELAEFTKAIHRDTGGIYKEAARLIQLKDEPDYQAVETVEATEEVTEVVGDKAVVKTVTKTKEIPLFDEIPCVDEDGNGICDICNTTHKKFPITQPKTVKVPRMIEGKKVSDADKARLAELMEKL
jgi:hypothetical protein